MMKIDLHSHTHFSDGHLSPIELVQRAHNQQVDVLAITDHDTTAALGVAKAYQAIQKRPLHIFSGVELSTRWHGFEIHILGFNIDETCPVLQERLLMQGATRTERARLMCDKLARIGIEGVFAQAMKKVGSGQITRAHIAQVLLDRGIVSHFQQAFTQFLGKDKKAYVTPQWIDIETAITWIHEARGHAVVAHPGHYDMKTKWLRRLLADFKTWGGDAMEVTHPNMQPTKKALLADLAREFELYVAVGSDFHMPSRWSELGKNLHIAPDLKPIWASWDNMFPQSSVSS